MDQLGKDKAWEEEEDTHKEHTVHASLHVCRPFHVPPRPQSKKGNFTSRTIDKKTLKKGVCIAQILLQSCHVH